MEKDIERKFRLAIEKLGGLAPKFTSPGRKGMPDRIVLLPGPVFAFVETKAPGKTLAPLQRKRKRELEKLGFKVFVLDDPNKIEEVCDAIQTP